jgi:hypothetical protein
MDKWCLLWAKGDFCLTANAWAAWAQAFFSVGAIFVAVWVAYKQAKTARELNEKHNQQVLYLDKQRELRLQKNSAERVILLIKKISEEFCSAREDLSGKYEEELDVWESRWRKYHLSLIEYCLQALDPETLRALSDSIYIRGAIEAHGFSRNTISMMERTINSLDGTQSRDQEEYLVDMLANTIQVTEESINGTIRVLSEKYEHNFGMRPPEL